MARRVSLPSADDLFRPTVEVEPDARGERSAARSTAPAPADTTPVPPVDETAAGQAAGASQTGRGGRRTSGRVKHDEKMTVYVTSGELLDLEQARLRLRAEHAVNCDRGRLVREAVALALADLEENGADSAIVRRLRGQG